MKQIIIVLALLINFVAFSQEFTCRVNVQIDAKLSSASLGDRGIFERLRKSIYEFMNTTAFSDNKYKQNEKIDCELTFIISEYTQPNLFKGKVQIQYRRPVYNSDYQSLIMNHIDENIQFIYNDNENIQFSPNAYITELGSLLAFYANYIIGIDNCTFEKNGGTVYFDAARVILNAAQNSSTSTGWKAFDDKSNNRNRYWLLENLLNPLFAPLKSCYYDYHRKGLDAMYTNEVGARTEMYKALEELKILHKVKPMSFNVQMFFLAKRDELVAIFKKAPIDDKMRLIELLTNIDPTNTSQYLQINK